MSYGLFVSGSGSNTAVGVSTQMTVLLDYFTSSAASGVYSYPSGYDAAHCHIAVEGQGGFDEGSIVLNATNLVWSGNPGGMLVVVVTRNPNV